MKMREIDIAIRSGRIIPKTIYTNGIEIIVLVNNTDKYYHTGIVDNEGVSR